MSSKFSDGECYSIVIESSWRQVGSIASVACQTEAKMYEFSERETITGINTEILQNQVTSKNSGITLLDHFCKLHKKKQSGIDVSSSIWKSIIENGLVTVDCEVCTNPEQIVETDFFLEYVECSKSVQCQTENSTFETIYFTNSKNIEGSAESKTGDQDNSKINSFLNKVLPTLENELISNYNSKAFDGYDVTIDQASEDITYWKTLSVDLEKRKVVYPDWSKGKHFPGSITACHLNRNGARIYDIDFKDGSKLLAVKEEHILVLEEGEEARMRRQYRRTGNKKGNDKKSSLRLQVGVRVHAKIESKTGVKYHPGSIIKVSKTGTVDVECEGGNIERGLTQDDIIQGLEEGQLVEARHPVKVQLNCTGVCWNATGSALAVAYGRNDITGWCEYPGAVCIWTIFSRNFNPDNPEYVLDHTSCLTCVRCHPDMPAVIAAGSFNGELVIWNLNTPEKPIAVSPIDEWSHKEPVMDVEWVYDSTQREYLITTVGADGKVLFWSLTNGLTYPIRGTTLSNGKQSKRHYPSTFGGSCLSFSSSSSSLSHRPKWVMVGLEGGGIVRGQAARILGSSALNVDTLKNKFNMDETYTALRRGDETFAHESHVGPVNAIECSPFHRSLVLTGGNDGSVRLYHVLERAPLKAWDPSPPPNASGVTSPFGSITCARFSKVRPLLFGACSSDGFVYLFDIGSPSTAPIATLEAPSTQTDTVTSNRRSAAVRRIGFTGIAFNRKQRDLFAACDNSGRVHIWKLGWKLANKHATEQSVLDSMGNSLVE